MQRSVGLIRGYGIKLRVASRVVSDLMEMMEEAEDEEAIAGEGGAN
jgi:hypothetical protein